MKPRAARVVAGTYISMVVLTYAWGMLAHDPTGLVFLPFLFLAFPWGYLGTLIPVPDGTVLGGVAYAVVSIAGSGVNALILYFLVARTSALLARFSHHTK